MGFLLWGRADQIGNSGTGQGRARAAAARVDIWPRIIWGGLYGGHMVTPRDTVVTTALLRSHVGQWSRAGLVESRNGVG